MSSPPPPPGFPGSTPPPYPNPPGGIYPAGPGGAPPPFPGDSRGPGGYPPGPPGGYPAGYGPYSGHREYAGFGTRLGSHLLDALVTLLIMLPFLAVFIGLLVYALDDCYTIPGDNGQDQLKCPPGALKAGPLALGIAAAVVGLIVAYWLMARWAGKGQTPGMKATNISLLDKDSGQPIGTGRAFGRMLFAWFISGNICFLGYLWMLWDKDKQTWHDKVVGSVVVRN